MHLGILTTRRSVVIEAIDSGRVARVPENRWVRSLSVAIRIPGMPALLRAR